MTLPRSALVAAIVVATVASGCSGSDRPKSRPESAPTPITKLKVAQVRLVRAPFCDRLPGAAVRRALGGKAETDDTWGNGDPVPGGDSGDVGHELGCAWTGTTGTAARAWVFARAITADFAGTLVAQAARQQGCTAEPTALFGAPAVLQTCTLADGVERDRRAGLFTDTWVTCEVAGPASGHPRDRLDRWCADVVAALGAG